MAWRVRAFDGFEAWGWRMHVHSRTPSILIIEDEPILQLAYLDMIESWNWKSAGTAATMPAALLLVETSSFDAAILDGELRGESSEPVAERLLELHLPFVTISATPRSRLCSCQCAGSCVLSKPVREDALRHELETALKGDC
ncbi:response regulator [Histidinibacterium aquaticum]|uniref:Response regulator n=1 Tax=Histidinibacterium aquaticum TaxID=2613962 RepID=A0A5J5GF55_9RHOB|nr:response regulator [Histidinibacterium aquaticum]